MLSDDLENWMGNLSFNQKSLPVINLAIPGSHDSMSYGIDKKSKLAPDAEKEIVPVYHLLPCIVRRWARTQNASAMQQLKIGVRYFDLRVAKCDDDQKLYFVHGLYCENIIEPFKELRSFLNNHLTELIVLDCQHFYNFSAEDHKNYSRLLLKYFGDILYENQGLLSNCTLHKASCYKKQVLIVYRDIRNDCQKFWSSNDWPTPWPNTINIPELKDYLDLALSKRAPEQGFVSQLCLTPDASFIMFNIISSLKVKCAKQVLYKMKTWIKDQTPGRFQNNGKPTCNVFIADFVDLNDSEFCKTVVNLNEKIK